MRTKTQKTSAGFTLIEILIVFFIFIAIFNSVWMIYKKTLSSNTALSDSFNSQEEVRKALTSMTASIRSASPSSTGSYPISAASSTALTYYSDIDHDGLKEQIRYFLSGNILKKGLTEPTGNPLTYLSANEKVSYLIRNVVRNEAKPIFSYYDDSYTGTGPALSNPPNILDIRLIKINVLIDRDPTKAPAAAEFTTQVSIRNLKDNL